MLRSITDKYKNYVQKKMEDYVVRYFAAHPDIKLIVVTGSVGKTSTKNAIADMLSQKYDVRLHRGNHNTQMSVPLALLGIPYPENIKNPFAWKEVFKLAEARILQKETVNVIVQELGADTPGEIAHFGSYLKPDIAVITAITPEHMEFFKTMEAVAKEEMAAANFSKSAIINRDDIDPKWAQYLENSNINTYGTSPESEYNFTEESFDPSVGRTGKLQLGGETGAIDVTIRVLGSHSVRPAVAAATVGSKLGLSVDEIQYGFSSIKPVPGRMNLLDGTSDSMLIDDTYNSSPVAAVAAVDTLFEMNASNKIALMGDMNELGEMSADEHARIGSMFNPERVDWLITVGPESEKYMAPAAKANGCQVKSFRSSVEAGAFARSVIKPKSLILFKGSQGGVFLEEAVKILLRRPAEYNLLVRQSPAWLEVKEDFFASLKS